MSEFMLINKQLSIYLVRLPLPFALNHVNSYAIKGNDGWWLIDTGLNTEESRKVWQQFMVDNEIMGSDIKGIYLTHAHPDHFGAAGWLQELSGAPVFASRADAKDVYKVWQGSGPEATERVTEHLIRNGMPLDFAKKATETIKKTRRVTKPHPTLSIVDPGQLIQLGDFQYKAVFTPGHSDGHMCYFNEQSGVLFSGDHLLAKITSNISLWPFGQADPLKNYLDSLQVIRGLPCQIVLPSHGRAFEGINRRISELVEHHESRLKLMKECISGDTTTFEICRQVFGQNLDYHGLRFAMTETVAHLMHLVYRGELEVNERNGIEFYSRAEDLITT